MSPHSDLVPPNDIFELVMFDLQNKLALCDTFQFEQDFFSMHLLTQQRIKISERKTIPETFFPSSRSGHFFCYEKISFTKIFSLSLSSLNSIKATRSAFNTQLRTPKFLPASLCCYSSTDA